MFRLKRMKPQGAASRKNATSSGVRAAPEQPAMKARVMPAPWDRGRLGSVLRDEALAPGTLELVAERRGIVFRHRPYPNTIQRVAVDLGLPDQRRTAIEVAVFLLQLLKCRARFSLCRANGNLHGPPADRPFRGRGGRPQEQRRPVRSPRPPFAGQAASLLRFPPAAIRRRWRRSGSRRSVSPPPAGIPRLEGAAAACRCGAAGSGIATEGVAAASAVAAAGRRTRQRNSRISVPSGRIDTVRTRRGSPSIAAG